MYLATLMLLGSGELGREFAIAAKRLGCKVIACDRYANAPAMQVADASEVFSMLDGAALRTAVEKHRPDHIVPEIEAIDTAMLGKLEAEGWHIVPSVRAVQLTMNRDGIRDFAADQLGLVTSRYRFAESREAAIAKAAKFYEENMKMFGELRLVRAITDEQIAAMRDPSLVPNTKLPRIEDAVKAGGFLAGTPVDIIEELKKVEQRYPGLERVICTMPLGTHLADTLEQLDRFAKEVMPAFRPARAAAAAD